MATAVANLPANKQPNKTHGTHYPFTTNTMGQQVPQTGQQWPMKG
jgi:hypothetical protein